MSEYQRIAFRAIDGPVSEKNLKFMERQSTRAEITPWAFDNEYHFGDFHGDTMEMLRRGYDVLVHYANFGIRTLMLRVPHGLPDFATAKLYLDGDSLRFEKDKQGPAGILCMEPCFEPDQIEELWDIDELVGRLVGVRAEVMDGDLRPLYLARLAIDGDGNHDPDESKEVPVPAGLKRLSPAQRALAKFFGLDQSLIAAAAEDSPALGAPADQQAQFADWLRGQPQEIKDRWMADWMADAHTGARRELLAEFQKSSSTSSWPTAQQDRSRAALETRAEEIHHEQSQKAAEAAARKRAKMLADMAADPSKTLLETEELVAQRATSAYREAVELLDDLREALAGTARSQLAEEQAWKLKNEHPNLHMLTAELRKKGFVPKATNREQPSAAAQSRGVKKAME
ncbi:MAG TPA: hypothetical protein VKS79_05655 [Gemmataceae bacterium]|nr:hypothetical protein [Gemmataceae bacterium]